MKDNNTTELIRNVIGAYSHIGEVHQCAPLGSGYINDTYSLSTESGRYVLQRINGAVFPDPQKVMSNIIKITEHIRKKAAEQGIDPYRSTVTIVNNDNDEPFFVDRKGSYWRLSLYISNTVTREKIGSAEDMRACAAAFGAFTRQLADFPANTLYETIEHFHNTPHRYNRLVSAIERDTHARAASVVKEIEFALSRRELPWILERARAIGELPLRVTHNDTKLSNILFDSADGSAVAVIDLDTVMPGYSVNDFGDAVRSGASTAAEDETDLSLVSMDIELFRAAADGYVRGCSGTLRSKEIELLPYGAMLMTYECGIRFLTDYLKGDVYFKTQTKDHNIIRCRNQFALLADMERKLNEMKSIVAGLK